MTPVTGNLVSQWVNARMPFPIDFGLHEAIGFHRDGKMVCGAVFNNFHRKLYGNTIDVTFATAGQQGLRRSFDHGVLRALFRYAFDNNVVRLQAMTSKNNLAARNLLENLGFTCEGVIKKAWDGRTGAALYRMFPEDCKWLGKPVRESMAA